VTALLDVRDASVRIGGTTILEDAAIAVDAGELVALVGPNGAGKSTLARSAAGLQRLSSGAVTWAGEDVARLRGRRLARIRAFMPQRARVPQGVLVREAVALGRAPHIGPLQRLGRPDHDAIDRAMHSANVVELSDRSLVTLSGGELQRVQIAVALAQQPRALIADEPTAHLDLGATAGVARLLRGLAAGGLAVLLVAHDLALTAAVADRAVVLSHGRSIATGAPADVLTPEMLARVWHVDAALTADACGRTALSVGWLQTTQEEHR
jgi:iron complex transport system ATP-binding protein